MIYRLGQKVQKEREKALQAIHVEEKYYEQSLADLVVDRCYSFYALYCINVCMYIYELKP